MKRKNYLNQSGTVTVTLKKKAALSHAVLLTESGIANVGRYRTKNLPTAGALLKEEDSPDKQISFDV